MNEPDLDVVDRVIGECFVEFLPRASETFGNVSFTLCREQPVHGLVQTACLAERSLLLVDAGRLIALRDDH